MTGLVIVVGGLTRGRKVGRVGPVKSCSVYYSENPGLGRIPKSTVCLIFGGKNVSGVSGRHSTGTRVKERLEHRTIRRELVR